MSRSGLDHNYKNTEKRGFPHSVHLDSFNIISVVYGVHTTVKLVIIMTRIHFLQEIHSFWYSTDLGSEMKRWVTNSPTAKAGHVPTYSFHATVACAVLLQQTPLTRDLIDMIKMPFVEPRSP